MPVLGSKPLQGLTANDRSLEDKQAINSLTGNTAPVQEIPDTVDTDTTSMPTYGNKALINQLHNRYHKQSSHVKAYIILRHSDRCHFQKIKEVSSKRTQVPSIWRFSC